MGFSCVLWEKEILYLGRLEKIYSIFFNFGVVYYLGFKWNASIHIALTLSQLKLASLKFKQPCQ